MVTVTLEIIMRDPSENLPDRLPVEHRVTVSQIGFSKREAQAAANVRELFKNLNLRKVAERALLYEDAG